MQSIVFCNRCRGMRVGWNVPFFFHCVMCEEWVSKSSKLLILTVILAVFIFSYPTPSTSVFSGVGMEQPIQAATFQGPVPPSSLMELATSVPDPAIGRIKVFLKGYGVDESRIVRVAESIVASAKKHNLDPRLIASIMIVESRANPFAISGKDAIGIMQIHLPTWGHTADREGINLFNIEDNIEFGTRILKDYARRFGLWEGVKRYKGWVADDPESEHSAEEYLAKVQRVYAFRQPLASAPEVLQ
jgi:soluble lytic murein transglycosylase-like protein